jgi:hypothetical protein
VSTSAPDSLIASVANFKVPKAPDSVSKWPFRQASVGLLVVYNWKKKNVFSTVVTQLPEVGFLVQQTGACRKYNPTDAILISVPPMRHRNV